MDPHIVRAEDAAKIAQWLDSRGGIAIWQSINLSNPGASWTTPAKTEDGQPYPKPTWEASNAPERIITSPADVIVSVDKEVKRFRVGVRMGSQGMSLKVTDGGTRRIRRAVIKAGDGAYHVFDYETQEAVIMAPATTTPLLDWQLANLDICSVCRRPVFDGKWHNHPCE
jgi:hypothetical protein